MGQSGVLIVGQGVAGTALAWALAEAGRDFKVVDTGHEAAASRVGAGLVNPVTGERWALAPGWAERARRARHFYARMEAAWRVRLVTELRIRRSWRDPAEGERVRAKVARGELAPWVRREGVDAEAAWIEEAWRLDLPALITKGREWLRSEGRLSERKLTTPEAGSWPGPVVWCTGAAEARESGLRPIGGETLEYLVEAGDDWPSSVVWHDGIWILPVGSDAAGRRRVWAGASYVREEAERTGRRELLRASVARQLARFRHEECAVWSGWRMTTPDREPRSGWLAGRVGKEGLLNGLGSKGALLAPGLAEAWVGRLGGVDG